MLMNGKHFDGKWQLHSYSELKEYGMGEDEMLYCAVYFQMVTSPQGYRYLGPVLGNNRDHSREEVEAWKSMMAFMPDDFDPATHSDWQPWFPAYGSEAYCRSGQEQANIHAEKEGIDYYPG